MFTRALSVRYLLTRALGFRWRDTSFLTRESEADPRSERWNEGERCSDNRDVIFTRTRTEEAADRRSSQRRKDGRDDADAGGRKLHESPAIIALVDSSTDSPFCWVDRRFPDARTLDFLVLIHATGIDSNLIQVTGFDSCYSLDLCKNCNFF
ncbi:hypothetical protein LXL04_016816 [Taraxacum kok-saghyz]